MSKKAAMKEESHSENEAETADDDHNAEDDFIQQFAQALHVQDATQVLEEVSFEGVVKYIASGKCKNIITMVGAGISTSAGIPDFRSPGTGLYDNLQSYNLPNPQAIFMIDFFLKNPKPFFVLAKALYPGAFKPTPSHYFIRLLHEKGLLLRHYTQNIDTLERVAGLPEEKLVEAHGTFQTSHCLECSAQYSLPWMKEKIFADEVPICEEDGCRGLIKPDIVFFGESLPPRFVQCVTQDFTKCDLLIVMGTSLVVHPFASLTGRVPPSTPRLYINLEKGEMTRNPLLSLFGISTGEFSFNGENNVRDVFKQAACDDGCYELAEKLGWGKELRNLVKKEHTRIDQETSGQTTPKQNAPIAGEKATGKETTVAVVHTKKSDTPGHL